MEKPVIKRGAWSYEEDKKLAAYIKKYGIWNWNQMPKFAGLSRSGKSCRLRWMNYLRPDVKLGKFSEEEDETIIRLHDKLGNRWSEMARKLPGRTDNEIKNHWHTRLKKRVFKSKKNTVVNPAKKVEPEEKVDSREEEHIHRAEIVRDDRVGNAGSVVVEEDPYDVVFWTQPFLIEASSMEYYDQPFGYENSQFDDMCFDFLFSFSETQDILSSI